MDGKSFHTIEMKATNRMSKIANQSLYDGIKRLSPGQIQTLAQRPDMMDKLVKQLGVKMVQVLMSQKVEHPTEGLIQGDLTTRNFGIPMDLNPEDKPPQKESTAMGIPGGVSPTPGRKM